MLIFGAVLATVPNPSKILLLVNAIIFFAALAISVFLANKKLEADWYSTRAVAESVKTATWRYMMCAEPYPASKQIVEANSAFGTLLSDILKSNNGISNQFSGEDCASEQISATMKANRTKSLKERKTLYLTERIDDQRKWYADKTRYNQQRSRLFFWLLIACQSMAVLLVVSRVAFPNWEIWPTEVFVVVAGSVTTWVQLKRFEANAASYSLAAHEISLIQTKIDKSNTDSDFSNFVQDTENAFSREHTQWVAKVQH